MQRRSLHWNKTKAQLKDACCSAAAARKFSAETRSAVLKLLHASCETGTRKGGSSSSLNLLTAAYCKSRKAEQRQR
jgi:hypothetical protein